MDYKQKYPEDPTYKETEENARVFHVYNDESQIFDNDMILEAGDSLDILLVFAGLFASVLTTFVAQTSQSLSPDKTEISNSLLREMISLQRAQENGTSFTSIPTADTSFVASRSDIWVNSLWFVSLALSLSTALLAVIAKQWLRQYSSFISGTPRERALIRQFRYDSLEKWGVRLIIGLLPTILHVSLFLFMGGLVVFLLPLNNTLARVVASVTGFICAAYVIMNVLPVIFPQCPYRTPLSEILNSIYGFVVFIPVFLRALLVMVPCILVIFPWILVASLLEHVRVVDDGNDWIPDWLEALVLKPEWITFTVSWPDPLREVERLRANKADSWGRPLGISGTLMWLAQNTSDISAKAIVAEAVGSVCHPSFTPSEGTIFDNAIKQQLSVISQWGIRDGQLLGAGDERIIERLMRSAFLVGYNIPSDELPTDVQANSTLLAFAGTYYCTARFHAGGEVKVLETHLIFSLVLEQYEMLEVFEAPTWIWWMMCKQAIFDKHFLYYLGEINYFCTKGIIDIGSPGEFLNLLHISPMLRHTVREHMIEIYSTRKSRQLQRPISPDTLSALSEFYVTREFEKNLLSPFSTVSLVNFFIYNFAQCTDFWMGSGEVE